MKSTLFTAGLLLTAALGASSSFAGEIGESYTGPVFQNSPSSPHALTREAVRAAYFAARDHGHLPRLGQGG